MSGGWVRPVGNGQTQVTVTVAGQTVTVAGEGAAAGRRAGHQFSPRGDAGPVAGRAATSGACHGYSLGKNGFKLSLRGADPEPDYLRHRQGFARPARQLAGARGQPARRQAARRRAARRRRPLRARQPVGRDPRQMDSARRARRPGRHRPRSSACGSCPTSWCLQPGQKHRLQLIAEYNDGTMRDVTRLGIFSANNDAVRRRRRGRRRGRRRCRARPRSWPASSGPSPPPASSCCKPDAELRRRRRCRRTTSSTGTSSRSSIG